LDAQPLNLSADARADVSMPAEPFMREHHAYQRLMLRLASEPEVDIVHNNSLHYLPVAMAALLSVPVITTLHTPPTPWLESSIGDSSSSIVAVSEHTASRWSDKITIDRVIRNGIDLTRWSTGPGDGGFAVWSGRLVPEKGAHLAIDAAAEAGLPIVLAGPASDTAYVRAEVLPRLGPRASWVGHLDHHELARLVGEACVAVVTPCWDEPFGLVVAEALASGTPVAAFARGAIPEIVTEACASLAEAGDVEGLAGAIRRAAGLDRGDARAHAEETCSSIRMTDEYERMYADAS
jgi:glycosyltransferase involved in cell wall biosynthesis